ncbi:uncharacterized protein K452DRAFT_274234 [Aplosporella prunicola CBS 121167]|uniref:Rhodopsin domain-containing protein n=1 Tax=Aplosporella prunicola CBS 121167 TaxID=1176127 RepID=A0A6A6BBD3_9PEZI|nr:uncharacterized protein K452DRAFT_274234 [Aplosporella prunicola CBS 121167]KAF2139791.1 hypothetical protein K452DRAFT_274234 [Aplosporella prunicola CBS 121167]
MTDQSPTPAQMLAEAIIFWVIGFILFLGRIWSRAISNGGIRNLQTDDYLMALAVIFWTALLILLQVSSRYETNLFPKSQLQSILANPKDVSNRIYGSKVTVAVEQCMISATWLIKACLLYLYDRMTTSLKENKFVRAVSIYTAITYVVQQIFYFGIWCRPFQDYWAVPPDNEQCANYANHLIMGATFNISSDALMLLIPVPLIMRAQMKLQKKAILCAVFSLGIFVIIAAILNKYYNFALPGQTVYMLWYIRECSTSIFVSNIACWWPLLRKLFKFKSFEYGSYKQKSPGYGYDASGVKGTGKRATNKGSNIMLSVLRDKAFNTLGSKDTSEDRRHAGYSTSEENINNPSHGMPLEIWHQVEYDVEQGPEPTTPHPSDNTYKAQVTVTLSRASSQRSTASHPSSLERRLEETSRASSRQNHSR